VIVGLLLLGVLATLSCKVLTAEDQSFDDCMLWLQPMQKVVWRMHFSPYSPVSVGGGSIGSDKY
jgi:hypothetical protein